MAKIDIEYHNLLNTILFRGEGYEDPNRKGVTRIEIPHYSFYHSFEDGFPALTTKKLAWKSVVGETLWILRGQTNIKHLLNDNINIWNKDAYNYYVKKCKDNCSYNLNFIDFIDAIKTDKDTYILRSFHDGIISDYSMGGLGKVYGHQLRNFGGNFDQLNWIINEMKNNPLSTKKDVTYINPCDKDNQGLTPCHTGWSVIVKKDLSGFDLEFKMGSVDTFLGLPFNIASYGLLAKILEKITGLKALGIRPILNNVHIYEPHLDAVSEQLKREVNKYWEPLSLEDFTGFRVDMHGDIDQWLSSKEISDFKINGYESYPSIKATMLPYSN